MRQAKTKSAIVVEALHVRCVIRDRHLSRSIADVGWPEFGWVLEYKTMRHGSRPTGTPRFYASTKTPSACGHLKSELPLADRGF